MHIKDVRGKNVKCGECGVLSATRRLVCENAAETIYLCDECFGDVSKFLTKARPLLDAYWSRGEKLPLLANCDEELDEDRALKNKIDGLKDTVTTLRKENAALRSEILTLERRKALVVEALDQVTSANRRLGSIILDQNNSGSNHRPTTY